MNGNRIATPADCRRIVLYLEYEGTRYHGFQIQKNRPTIQGAVEQALQRLTGIAHRIAGAGRTDAGVHAAEQVISFLPQKDLPLRAYLRGLNHYLPEDIAVKAAYGAPAELDVRRSAVSRTYRFTIRNQPTPSPLWRRFAITVKEPLDAERMNRAANVLIGRRDFSPFAGALGPRRHGIRRMDRATVHRDGDFVTLEMEASGFLPQQVRRTMGALVRLGTGRMSEEEFRGLLCSGRPGAAKWAMPPHGLCLMGVRYPDFPPEDQDREEHR